LKADGHDVFFDGAKLAGGENYHHVIREQIAETDLVFLISYGQHFLSDRGSSARARRERSACRSPTTSCQEL